MGEALFIAFKLLFGFGLPAAMVALNFASLSRSGRRGLNIRCAIAALLFAIALLLGVGLFPMLTVANDYIKFFVMSAGAAMASLSAVTALWGMYEIRRRPSRWPRGWKRAIWVFWLNVIYLGAFAAFYFLATHPDTFDKVQRAVQ
jgi:hypothetical protein